MGGRRVKVVARGELRFPPLRSRTCSTGKRQGNRRTIDSVADRGPKLPSVVLMLDREIGNAAPRIELIRRGKAPVGHASRQARHCPQWSDRRVGRQLEVGEDRAQEQPGAKFARHQIGVLALPAQTRARGQRLLEQRGSVDEHLDIRLAGAPQRPGRLRVPLACP